MISFLLFFKRTCAHLELKETKYHPFPTVKDKSTLALSVYFYITNNFAELKPLPVVEFSFNALLCWFSIASLSQISPLIFFPSEKDLFGWIYLLKGTTRKTKILISPTWKKILETWNTLFELVQIEVQCCKKLFQNVFARKSWIFWKYHEKETEKNHAQNWKNMCIIHLTRIFALPAIQCKW